MVERQAEDKLEPGLGAPLRECLSARDGIPTIVRLADGQEMLVYDVAWGRDMGDMWEHVTANCSPPVEGREIYFFYLSEVESLRDPATGSVLMQQTPSPGET